MINPWGNAQKPVDLNQLSGLQYGCDVTTLERAMLTAQL